MDVLRTQVPPVLTPAGGRESPVFLGRVCQRARGRKRPRESETRIGVEREKSKRLRYEGGGLLFGRREKMENSYRTRMKIKIIYNVHVG